MLPNFAFKFFSLRRHYTEGCVYLDEGDRQMVLMRKGWTVTPLVRQAVRV